MDSLRPGRSIPVTNPRGISAFPMAAGTAIGVDPETGYLRPVWLGERALATAVEELPAGTEVVLDLNLGLAARPFGAQRD